MCGFYILCELVFSRLFIVKGVVVSFAIYVLVCVCVFVLFRCLYGFLVLRVKSVKSFVFIYLLPAIHKNWSLTLRVFENRVLREMWG